MYQVYQACISYFPLHVALISYTIPYYSVITMTIVCIRCIRHVFHTFLCMGSKIMLCLELKDGYFNLFMVTSLMIMNLALTVLYLV